MRYVTLVNPKALPAGSYRRRPTPQADRAAAEYEAELRAKQIAAQTVQSPAAVKAPKSFATRIRFAPGIPIKK